MSTAPGTFHDRKLCRSLTSSASHIGFLACPSGGGVAARLRPTSCCAADWLSRAPREGGVLPWWLLPAASLTAVQLVLRLTGGRPLVSGLSLMGEACGGRCVMMGGSVNSDADLAELLATEDLRGISKMSLSKLERVRQVGSVTFRHLVRH